MNYPQEPMPSRARLPYGTVLANSASFVTFAKCFCINPVYDVGRYKKRKGWVLIDLATRAETNFKTLRNARQHLIRLYMAAAPEKITTEDLP